MAHEKFIFYVLCLNNDGLRVVGKGSWKDRYVEDKLESFVYWPLREQTYFSSHTSKDPE